MLTSDFVVGSLIRQLLVVGRMNSSEEQYARGGKFEFVGHDMWRGPNFKTKISKGPPTIMLLDCVGSI